MNYRIPELIQPSLENYTSLINQHLPDLLGAFYLEGSIALGEFNPRFSDIDFVAVLSRPADLQELERLRQIHRDIEKGFLRWKLSGSYLQWNDLGPDKKTVDRLSHYHDGVLRSDGRFEPDSVTGWILKNHGISVIGPESCDLAFTVDWNVLIARMHDNLNRYWAGWTKRPGRILALLSDWGIQWSVLGVLRQFYSFRENTITTKVRAGNMPWTTFRLAGAGSSGKLCGFARARENRSIDPGLPEPSRLSTS